MELFMPYIRTLLKKWWIVLPVFLVTAAATAVFTFRQPYIYEATASFVLKPRSSVMNNQNDFVRALDTLSNRVSINTTYAEVALSKYVREAAGTTLGIPPAEQAKYTPHSRVIAGTNILELRVDGPDPVLVRDYTNAIGVEAVKYVDRLYDVFELEPLDAATVPALPVRPNRGLYMAIGEVLGLVLGVGLAFLSEYLKAPEHPGVPFDIVDAETGANTRAFFTSRLRQEMSRARRNHYPLSLALIRVEYSQRANGHTGHQRPSLMHDAWKALTPLLRDEDVLARFSLDTFALLIPDLATSQASIYLEDLRARLESVLQQGTGPAGVLGLRVLTCLVPYEPGVAGEDELLWQAEYAMDDVKTAAYRKPDASIAGHPVRKRTKRGY